MFCTHLTQDHSAIVSEQSSAHVTASNIPEENQALSVQKATQKSVNEIY